MYKAIVYYSIIVVVCILFDTVVSCIRVSLRKLWCVSVLPLLSYITLNIPIGVQQIVYKQIVGWCCLQVVGCLV